MILTRIQGLVMIVNTLMPVVLIVAGFLIVQAIDERAREADLQANVDQIDAAVGKMAKRVRTAGASVGKVAGEIGKVGDAIGVVAVSIDRIPPLRIPDLKVPDINPTIKPDINLTRKPPVRFKKVLIKMPTIRGVKVPLPKLPGAKELSKAMHGLNVAFRDVGGLAGIKQDVKAVIGAVTQLSKKIGAIAGGVLGPLKVIGIVAILWFGLSYVMWTFRRLRTGWALLRGRREAFG